MPLTDDALVALQRARDLGRAEAAVALAEQIFRRRRRGCSWRRRARSPWRSNLRVARARPRSPSRRRLSPCGSSRCRSDRSNTRSVKASQVSGLSISLASARAAAVRTEVQPARAEQTQIEKCGGRARSAVKGEAQRSRACRVFRDIGGVKDAGDLVAGLAVERDDPGGRGIVQRAFCRLQRVLGKGITGQKAQHALAARLLVMPRLALLLLLVGAVAAVGLLRQSRSGRGRQRERENGDPVQTHDQLHEAFTAGGFPARTAEQVFNGDGSSDGVAGARRSGRRRDGGS